MNDIQPLKPGKLKRKSKRNVSTSVVDLPAAGKTSASGNLLGDTIIQDFQEPSGASEGAVCSLVGMTSDCDESENNGALASHGAISDDNLDVTLKLTDEPEQASISPLDALYSEKPSGNKRGREEKEDNTGDNGLNVLKTSERSVQSQGVRLTSKKKGAKSAPTIDNKSSADSDRIEELLEQSREINQKCLDTLAKLQNTNIQNERRYTLNLIIAFSILAILTVVGVFVGINLKSEAKYNELKFKNEDYTNAVHARDILDAEFEREKRGSAAAFEVYQRIEQGLFEESVEKFIEVRDLLTHPAEIALLEQRIDEIQWKLAENAYHDGVMLFNASNYEQARDAFFKSLSFKENTAYSPRLNYYLAMSLFELGDFEGARRYFAQINSADLSSDMDAQARFHRAIAAEKLGDEAEAYEQFDQFLRKYRYHRLASEAAKHRAKVESGRRQ